MCPLFIQKVFFLFIINVSTLFELDYFLYQRPARVTTQPLIPKYWTYAFR